MKKANIASSLLATTLRGISGINAKAAAIKPKQLLELYDIENCPYCRLVREALTELDLDILIKPCPKSGTQFRHEAINTGGKTQFPLLVDPNTDQVLYESLEIVAYLYKTYGQCQLPKKWHRAKLQTVSSWLVSVSRLNRGLKAKSAKMPQKPLELYSFESSPYARPVRELLCELEIPYIVRNCGRENMQDWLLPSLRKALNITHESTLENRRHLQLQEGHISIPFLFDPNTGTSMFESADIMAYLREQYAY